MTKLKVLLLCLLLSVAAAAYYWQIVPQGDSSSAGSAASKNVTDNLTPDATGTNRFDFSGGEQRVFKRPSRNLFGLLFPPPPPPKVKVVKVVVPQVVPVAPAPPSPPPVFIPAPMPVVAVPMPAFKLLGFLEKEGQLTVFISLQGKIHLVKKGGVFADDFKVVALNSDEITLGRVEGDGEVRLKLNDKSMGTSLSNPHKTSRAQRAPIRVFRPETRPINPFVQPATGSPLPVAHPPVNGAN